MQHTIHTYDAFVAVLRKDPVAIFNEYTPFKADLDHAVKGIAGEAGEIVDAVKKFTVYNQLYDDARIAHIVEELGDMEFYLQQLRNAIGVSREDCINANIAKLCKRYPTVTYTDANAKLRLDKAAEQQQTGEPTL